MFDISWLITVGSFRLSMLDSVEVIRSVEQLSDTAVIVLPGSVFNKAIEVEQKIKRGDKVVINLGYDGNLVREFDGYLDSISTDDGSIKLNCEDSLYLLKQPVADKEFINPDISDILKYIAGSFTVVCDYSFRYDKYVIKGQTAYQVLKKLQEETKANIYLKESVLHVHPQYSELFGSSSYSFQDNIEKSSLQYKNAEDRKLIVNAEGKGKDGKVIRETVGESGGDSITLRIDGVSDRATLRNLATEQLKVKSYTGYSGSFTGWLIPFCDAAYKIYLDDADYNFKSGAYYVLEVRTKVSRSGGEREIKIGKRL
jgi:hypothetical protein